MPIDLAVEIRPAASHEAEIITNLVRAAYARWVPVIGREPLPMRVDYERALTEHQFDVVLEQGTIIGVIETIQRDDHLWIENLAVLPKAQGRGIGKRLLAHAEQKALGAGSAELRLLTNGAFQTNVLLYKAVGYTLDREESFMNGTTVYMSKTLSR